MTGFTESSDAWATAWLDMQKQYLDAWMKVSGPGLTWNATTAPFAAPGGNLWANSFDQWSKLFGQGMPNNARDVSTRLFDLGKSYLDMSERFWQVLREGKGAALTPADWQAALHKTFGQVGQGFSLPGGTADPWSGFASLWGLPVNNWQRMATSFSPFSGDMEKALHAGQLPETGDMTRTLRHFLSVPPVGYTREWQEQQQEWARLFMEYAQAMQDFNALLGKVVLRALEQFGKRMSEKVKAGESFDGLRAVYNLWIDCGEEAYAEQVATAEFPQLQANMVNAQMRMKRHEQHMLEKVMKALNIPTRQEMDTTHKRVYELQRQLQQVQDAMEQAAQDAPAQAAETRTAAPKKKADAKHTRTAKRRAKPKTGKV